MPRSWLPAALFTALLGGAASSGCSGAGCEHGTLVAALTYDAVAMTADTLVVQSTINGVSMTASQPYTGQTKLRVPFPDVAYSTGLVVDVLVEARKGGAVVATAAHAGYALPATCAVLPLTFDEMGTHFTVSGNVDGLAGSGLSITDGTDTLPVAQSGPFTFPTQLASGQAFKVTVVKQPTTPSQTCTVTNGAGTIGDADVSIEIACATNRYTLSGAVTGLGSDGLQVEETSSLQIVSLSQFGTDFSFPTPLASGASYTVTVHHQPTTQTCTFAGGATSVSGMVVDMDIANLDLTCVGM